MVYNRLLSNLKSHFLSPQLQALEICLQRNFVEETVFLLSKYIHVFGLIGTRFISIKYVMRFAYKGLAAI